MDIEQEVRNAIKNKGPTQEQAAEKLGISRQTLINKLSRVEKDPDFMKLVFQKLKLDPAVLQRINYTNVNTRATGEDLRNQKAFAPRDEQGLIYVPIRAQAGYARNYTDPVFIDQLERIYVPGSPYRGEGYRYFEVEGDSMYPTLEDGMQVLAQKIEMDTWMTIYNYYIHVIVTPDQILMKRLFRLSDKTFVMISDNEELYPQTKISLNQIKELWLVKRRLDWRMAPPKAVDIKVKE